MVLESLSTSLKNTLKKVARSLFVDERLINELVRDIQRAMLQADVNVKLIFELTSKIKERALKEEPPNGVGQKEFIVKIVYDQLVTFLGEEKKEISAFKGKNTKILLVGLFGSGKTTSIIKMANYYAKRGFKVAAVGLDVHRPAAMDQLEQGMNQMNFPVFVDHTEKDPKKIYKKYQGNLEKFDIVLIDTAGRDALSKDLIEEIESLNTLIRPDERLLVLSADVGQAAQKQAEQFNKSCGITGVVVTKLDGTAKGGGALSACAATHAPIIFIGVGEKPEDLEPFNPKGFVGRLLGMGDIEALLEKAKESIGEEDAKEIGEKILKGDFNFLDLYQQLQSMKKLGPINKIMEMIPGLGAMNIPKEMLDIQEEKLHLWKHMMQSMTKEELEDPELLGGSRLDRIAKGSGTAVAGVRELLKQYRQSKKLVKMVKGKDPSKLMKKFAGKIPGMKW